MVGGFFLGALSSFGRGVGFAFAMLACVIAVLAVKVARRRSAFSDQLNSTLQMMAGALRTGYSLPQVISLVGQEAEAPTSEEFNRMAVEMRLGRDLADAIRDTSGRMKNADFLWAAGAIEIAREARARVIAVTATKSPLAEAADVALNVDVAEDSDIFSPVKSRLGHMAVLDILAVAVAVRGGEEMLSRLARARRAIDPRFA